MSLPSLRPLLVQKIPCLGLEHPNTPPSHNYTHSHYEIRLLHAIHFIRYSAKSCIFFIKPTNSYHLDVYLPINCDYKITRTNITGLLEQSIQDMMMIMMMVHVGTWRESAFHASVNQLHLCSCVLVCDLQTRRGVFMDATRILI